MPMGALPHLHFRRWFNDPANLIFAGLLLANLLPLWCFRFFPSQDGPAHLENAVILREYANARWPAVRTFYTINPNPDPNWLTHLVLAGLMFVVPPSVAEKLMLSGYVILLPLALRYAVRAVRPEAHFLAVLAFPFVPNLFLHMGFYNFCYSLPLFFFVVGYWLRHRDRFGWREALGLMLLGLLLYFGHLVSLAAAWVLIGVVALWLTALDVWLGTFSWAALRSRVLLPAFAFLPTVILALHFLLRQGEGQPATRNGESAWAILLRLEALVSFDAKEVLVALSVVAGFVLVTTYLLTARPRPVRAAAEDGLLVAAVVFLLLYFLMPAALAGGLFVNYRLTLYPFFALILWFAAQPTAHRAKAAVLALGAGSTVALGLLHFSAFARLNTALAEYVSVADLVEPGRTLLPLSFSHVGLGLDGKDLSARVGPFRHAAGYVAAERHIIDLANYEANTSYFPVRYRPEVNPYLHLGADDTTPDHGLESLPPHVDVPGYTARTGQVVEYVLIWGLGPGQETQPAARAIMRQLKDGGYERLAVSEAGTAQLYGRPAENP